MTGVLLLLSYLAALVAVASVYGWWETRRIERDDWSERNTP